MSALETGQLGGLGIDVYHTEPFPTDPKEPILSHPKVISTPHVAGVTASSYQEMGKIVANNVRSIHYSNALTGIVNSMDAK